MRVFMEGYMKNKCFAITAVCVLSVMLLSSGVYANPKTAVGNTETGSGSGGSSAAGQTKVGGDPGSAGNCTGVCADTKTKLLSIGSGKDKWTTEAAKEVGNTLRMLTDEEKAQLEAAREDERIQREVEREETKAKEKQDKIAKQYQQCLNKTKSSFGTNSFGDATEKAEQMCKAQQYKALMDAGLTDAAEELGVTPKDVRTAQETQAAMEYAQCIKTHNEAYCQKQLNQAYEKAKEEYYRNADSETVKAAVEQDFDRCMKESTGGSSTEIAAYCKQQKKDALEYAGRTDLAEEVDMSSQDKRTAKEVQAEMNYDECMKKTKSAQQCTKQYEAERKTAEMDYLKENPTEANSYADNEHAKCISENPGSRGSAYCAAKKKEILNEVGLTNEADSILNDPADKRIAKEVQAEKDYNACIQARKSDTACQKEYVNATEDAKLEYYRAEPEKGREEIDRSYWSCVGNGENIPTVRAKCSQQRDTMLMRSGLDTSVPVSQKPGTEQAIDYTDRMPGEYEIDRRVNEYMDQTLSGGGTIPSENSETNSSELSDPADDIYAT